MENKKGQCNRCKHFDRFYVKEVKRFDATKFGRCCCSDKTVNSIDSCNKFILRKPIKLKEKTLKYYLSNLLTEISQIRKVVEAEIRENEEL